MKSLLNPRQLIPILLIGVMVISAPIFAAVRAAAIGKNIAELYPLYVPFEIFSGAALVLMEGGALYVVSSYWRQFKPFTVYWNILAGIMLVIALALPFIATSYFVSAQYSLPIYEVLTWNHILLNHLTWLWSFSVACIPTILVIGLGIAHGIEEELPAIEQELKPNKTQLKTEAWGILSLAYSKGTWIYPPTLTKLMNEQITEAEAVSILSEWYEAMVPKRPGAKSKDEQAFIEAVQPVSLNGHNQ